MSNPFLEVQKAVTQYLYFVYEGGDALPECFNDGCFMHSSDGSQLLKFPMSILIGNESPASKGEERQEQIIHIDIAGPNLAYVKLKFVAAPHFYTDYFSLVRHDGQWKIVSKLWADAANPYDPIFPSVEKQEIEKSKIRDVIRTNVDALYEGDAEKYLSTFADGAEMFFTDENGKISAVDVYSFFRENFDGAPFPKQKGEPRNEFIQHIDMSGPYTAVVKLNVANAPAHFTDYLFMAAGKDGWKIVSKTTMADIRA